MCRANSFFKAISEGENDFEAIAIVGKYKTANTSTFAIRAAFAVRL